MSLHAVDAHDDPRGRFTHQCHSCHTIRRGLKLQRDVRVHRAEEHNGAPGWTGLAVACPCGASEHFNTNLGPEDEVEQNAHGTYAFRAQQARLIRAMMRHPHIGLATRETPLSSSPASPSQQAS